MISYLGHEFESGRCVLCGALEKSVRQFQSACAKAGALPRPASEASVVLSPEEREEVKRPDVSRTTEELSRNVVITDIKMPFSSILALTVKWALASALVGLVVWVIYAVLSQLLNSR